MKNLKKVVRIPPLKYARSFNLSFEPKEFALLEKLEDVGFFGSRINQVAQTIVVRWAQDSSSELESKFGLHYLDAVNKGYSSHLTCKQPRIITPYGKVILKLIGKPRYFVEQLAKAEPDLEIPNAFYQRNLEHIVNTIVINGLPRFVDEAKRQGAFDDGGFGNDSESTYG